MADVAQLVEPRFVVPVVVGSSPIVRPNNNPPKGGFFMPKGRSLSFFLQAGLKNASLRI